MNLSAIAASLGDVLAWRATYRLEIGCPIIRKPLAATAWGPKDLALEDPDGDAVCFDGRPARDQPAIPDE